jgi:hypothetical protein
MKLRSEVGDLADVAMERGSLQLRWASLRFLSWMLSVWAEGAMQLGSPGEWLSHQADGKHHVTAQLSSISGRANWEGGATVGTSSWAK